MKCINKFFDIFYIFICDTAPPRSLSSTNDVFCLFEKSNAALEHQSLPTPALKYDTHVYCFLQYVLFTVASRLWHDKVAYSSHWKLPKRLSWSANHT